MSALMKEHMSYCAHLEVTKLILPKKVKRFFRNQWTELCLHSPSKYFTDKRSRYRRHFDKWDNSKERHRETWSSAIGSAQSPGPGMGDVTMSVSTASLLLWSAFPSQKESAQLTFGFLFLLPLLPSNVAKETLNCALYLEERFFILGSLDLSWVLECVQHTNDVSLQPGHIIFIYVTTWRAAQLSQCISQMKEENCNSSGPCTRHCCWVKVGPKSIQHTYLCPVEVNVIKCALPQPFYVWVGLLWNLQA